MAKELAQHERRRNHTMVDQHGRQWETTIDFIANGPCDTIHPKFNSPLHVPDKYLKFQPNDSGRLKIDYDAWITDLEIGWRTWDQQLYDDAIQLFGSEGVRAYQEKKPELLRHTGVPPLAIDLVKGAKAGNKFMLGLTDKMPSWVEALMPKIEAKVEEFPDAEDELDKYGDYEEAADPEAKGGKKENPRKNNTKAAA